LFNETFEQTVYEDHHACTVNLWYIGLRSCGTWNRQSPGFSGIVCTLSCTSANTCSTLDTTSDQPFWTTT